MVMGNEGLSQLITVSKRKLTASLCLFIGTSIIIPSLSSFLVMLAVLILLNFLRLCLGPRTVVVRGRHVEAVNTPSLE